MQVYFPPLQQKEQEKNGVERSADKLWKKLEKSEKKVLTRWGWCGILTELSTRTASVNDETKKFEKT